jgi:hypothetical protein
VGRLQRIRASRITLEVASWTIGILVIVGLTIAVVALADHLGWSWPGA